MNEASTDFPLLSTSRIDVRCRHGRPELDLAPTMAHQVGAGQAAQQMDDARGRPASMANKSNPATQTIATPQGGGALHGIGETFSPDLHTGTGNFTVPITMPSERNGFQPQISLVYSTGNGNGPYGLGWSLTIPGVSRKTSKGIPRYRNDPGARQEGDTFILSGAEDLIPVSETGGITTTDRERKDSRQDRTPCDPRDRSLGGPQQGRPGQCVRNAVHLA